MAKGCFSLARSRPDDNGRTHRHLGATIVKLGQVKARFVWEPAAIEGRTGAAYSLGIIVRTSAPRGFEVYREGCTYRTRSLRGGPRDDIGSLIGQIPEKNALLRPHSLRLAPDQPAAEHTLSLTRTTSVADYVGSSPRVLCPANDSSFQQFAITLARSSV